MKKDYLRNINGILEDGHVEGIELQNIDMLKAVFSDKSLSDLIYKGFESNFEWEFNEDDLYMKSEDLVYRLHLAINKWLIPIYEITDVNELKSYLTELININIDLYSGVGYDDSDNEIIEEFKEQFPKKDVSI